MTQPQSKLSRSMRWVLMLVLPFILGGLGACSLLFSSPPDPLADYRPALAPGFEISPTELAILPRYSITLRVDPTHLVFTGTMQVTIPITAPLTGPLTTSPGLDDLYFRLYPNLPQYAGNLYVAGASVNGKTMPFSYEADGTAVRLSLVEPLAPGSLATVVIPFTGDLQQRYPDQYTIFGYSDNGIFSLASFYPILAGRRGEDWALDVADPLGDVGFHAAALYRVDVVLPPGEVIAATGTVVTKTLGVDGWQTTRYVQGPAREFALLFGPNFVVEEAYARDTLVRSYHLPEDAAAAHSALYDAVAAVEIYSDQFGPYPYSEMAVVQAPLRYYGMEFPGMSLIGQDAYNKYASDLENLVVHEVSHQWWYNLVGSDQTANPWLDEGLAEFSMYIYYLNRYGPWKADPLRFYRWDIPVNGLIDRGLDEPIGRPVKAYRSDVYETLVYGKGALFFTALRDELGTERFAELLRTYIERYRWRIATPADFQALAEEVAGHSLDVLFQQWVYGQTGK